MIIPLSLNLVAGLLFFLSQICPREDGTVMVRMSGFKQGNDCDTATVRDGMVRKLTFSVFFSTCRTKRDLERGQNELVHL